VLRDIVLNHPMLLGIACISWAAIAVWVVSLIGWMVQGEVDVLFGFVGIAVAFVLGYFSFMPPMEILRPYTAISVVGTVIVFPFLRQALNQRALVALDVEAMENAYEMLLQRPDNHLQRFKLARLMYDRGHVEPALAVAAEALSNMPEKLFTDEHRMMGRWRRQNPQANLAKPVGCIDCGHQNPPQAIRCERCGQPHLLEIARGRWVGRQFAKKLIAGWAAGILGLAGMPLASQLPPIPAILTMVAIMVVSVVVIWMAFRASGVKAAA
jgi:hypothetical protein